MRTLCVIAARGGSQGVPGKNIRPLLGKPLIAWSIETARAVPEFARVVVSTDSGAIAAVARDAGADVPFMRPEHLATAEAGKFSVWQHALDACERHYGERFDSYVDLDCTNPLIEVADVRAAVAQYIESLSRGVDAIFTVCRARRNPYFNLVEADSKGALKMSKSLGRPVLSRQSAPVVYEHVAGVYVLRSDYLRSASHLLDGHAEGYEVPEGKNLDVDSEIDFQLVEFLLKRRLGRLA